jgi:acetyltransferase-like isoleucine patch superfamily enzyme
MEMEMDRIKNALLRYLAVRKNVVHGSSFHVGPGSIVWAPRELRIGNNVYIGKFATIEVDGEIGDGVLVANSVGIVGRTDHDIHQIGTTISESAWVGNDPANLSQSVVIGSDVWIGYGAVIMSGTSIGDSAVIGAGSVVTKDVPPNSIVAGNPGRVVRQRFSPEEYEMHWELLTSRGVRRLVQSSGS